MRVLQICAIATPCLLGVQGIWTVAASAADKIYQAEASMVCDLDTHTCAIDNFPKTPSGKTLLLKKVSCEIYVSQGVGLPRIATFYVFGARGEVTTPRHRFPVEFLNDPPQTGGAYVVALSETPELEIPAGYRPVIRAQGTWHLSADGACTVVGQLSAAKP